MTDKVLQLLKERYPDWSEEALKERVLWALNNIKEYEKYE